MTACIPLWLFGFSLAVQVAYGFWLGALPAMGKALVGETPIGCRRRVAAESAQVTAPLDLDAINEELAGAGCLRPRTAAKVLAEIVRLRAESVPRSSLVRIGIQHSSLGGRIDVGPEREACYWNCRPGCQRSDVYVIREDTDA